MSALKEQQEIARSRVLNGGTQLNQDIGRKARTWHK
jgi:hypothetical protein